MSLRWTSHIAARLRKGEGVSKTQNGRFSSELHFAWRNSATKFFCESCKAFIGLSISAKIIGGDVPFYVKIWRILTHLLQNADFPSIFARSASAVTPNKKVLLILVGSPLRAFQWA